MKISLFAIVFITSTLTRIIWADTSNLTLADYLRRAQTQSPEVKIEKSINDEVNSRSQGIRLPPPMVGLMNMKESGNTTKGVELSQEIPFPTKIISEKKVRELEAKSQRSLFNYRKNEIILDARLAYFNFWESYQTKKILEEKLTWLKKHVKISRTSARTNSSAQIHLLGVESEVDLLENEVAEAQSLLVEKTNALKVFVPDLVTEHLTPETEPKFEIVEIDINTKNQLIDSKEKELQFAESLKNLKKQSFLPDFVIRYRSFEGNEMNPRNEELMLGLNLPFLFFWQPRSEVSEASARVLRAQAELQKSKINFQSQLLILKEKSESLKKQFLTLKEKIIPRALKRMNLVENLSARTMEGLEEHRMIMLDYLDLKHKEVTTRMNYEKTIIEILKLIGNEAEI